MSVHTSAKTVLLNRTLWGSFTHTQNSFVTVLEAILHQDSVSVSLGGSRSPLEWGERLRCSGLSHCFRFPHLLSLNVWSQIPPLLRIQIPAKWAAKRQQQMAQAPGSLLCTRRNRMTFLAPGLTQLWWIQEIGKSILTVP